MDCGGCVGLMCLTCVHIGGQTLYNLANRANDLSNQFFVELEE